MFRRSRETRAAAQTTPPTQEVAQDSAAIKADSLSDVSQSSSRGSLQDQPADKARPNSATSSRSHLRSDQPHKSVGVQTDVTGEVKPKKRRRRRTCGICLNRWTAIFVAFLAVIWRYEQQLTHVQDKVVESLAPHVPEYLSNTTELQRKLGFEIPSIFSESERTRQRPGQMLYEEGYRPKHPVIVIPGFVTSGLELWQGKPCATRFFRERIWGSMSMTHSFVRNSMCWLEHMALDERTGGDPPGVRLRAAEGLEAVDYFMPGYHVWAKLIEALADVGYESNMLVGETYDWRLAVPLMQQRDGYFTRLKNRIEIMHELQGQKVMVMSHSWGDNVFRNFMAWASSHDEDWVDKHVAHYANIAGPTLGVPKAISSFLSGETRDTAELGYIAAMLSNSMMPRNERVRLFRTWGAGIGMLPSGGPSIWGDAHGAPDDTPAMRARNHTFGDMITEVRVNKKDALEAERHHSSVSEFITHWMEKSASQAEKDEVTQMHDIDGAMKILLDSANENFREHVTNWAAVHVDKRSCHCHGDPEDYYFNPLQCPLPKAPKLRMYCMYGIGMPTERAYHYLNLQDPETLQGTSEGDREHQQEVLWKINGESHETNGTLDHGIRLSDGDGTVPLISLGTLCRKHWRHKSLNPSGIRIVSREHPHEPVNLFKDLRGGGKSADHVDILSNDGVLTDIIKIATGHTEEMDDKIHSAIDDIVARIPIGAD